MVHFCSKAIRNFPDISFTILKGSFHDLASNLELSYIICGYHHNKCGIFNSQLLLDQLDIFELQRSQTVIHLTISFTALSTLKFLLSRTLYLMQKSQAIQNDQNVCSYSERVSRFCLVLNVRLTISFYGIPLEYILISFILNFVSRQFSYRIFRGTHQHPPDHI